MSCSIRSRSSSAAAATRAPWWLSVYPGTLSRAPRGSSRSVRCRSGPSCAPSAGLGASRVRRMWSPVGAGRPPFWVRVGRPYPQGWLWLQEQEKHSILSVRSPYKGNFCIFIITVRPWLSRISGTAITVNNETFSHYKEVAQYCIRGYFRGGFIFANFTSQTSQKFPLQFMSIYCN